MLNMGRCFAWFFESRSYLAHLGSIIVLVVNSFFVIYLHVNDPNKDYNYNNKSRLCRDGLCTNLCIVRLLRLAVKWAQMCDNCPKLKNLEVNKKAESCQTYANGVFLKK